MQFFTLHVSKSYFQIFHSIPIYNLSQISDDAIPRRKRSLVGVGSWRAQTWLFLKIGDYALCCQLQIIKKSKTFICYYKTASIEACLNCTYNPTNCVQTAHRFPWPMSMMTRPACWHIYKVWNNCQLSKDQPAQNGNWKRAENV